MPPQGQTVLHLAARYLRLEIVEVLLAWKPEVPPQAPRPTPFPGQSADWLLAMSSPAFQQSNASTKEFADALRVMQQKEKEKEQQVVASAFPMHGAGRGRGGGGGGQPHAYNPHDQALRRMLPLQSFGPRPTAAAVTSRGSGRRQYLPSAGNSSLQQH